MTRVVVIGAGQLGQMLGESARALDVECVFLDPADRPPAARVGKVVRAEFNDIEALVGLADGAAALTYEFENVPVDALGHLPGALPVHPPPRALSVAQDRAHEKTLFERLEIPLPRWHTVDSIADLHDAAAAIGLPLVLKTRRFGYDGKGQAIVRTREDIEPAFASLPSRALVAEQWIDFDREVSAIGVRARDGATAVYPLTENEHRGGILRVSRAPAGPDELADRARDYLLRLLDELDYVGTLALELFVKDGALLANEFAPRVHNSGHWTIEGAETSQFENHLRAVLGLPLGNTASVAHAGMVNLIGHLPALDADPAARRYLHDYGKAPRPGRKLGHVTVLADDPDRRDALVQELDRYVSGT